ncbi:uncharacterized protein UTRI_00602_B [Ustilago trichophora]|uniref:WD repeat-containing protein 44 n=1 Tax=Ustilago trichophora TaxID=86804 RepID=A0A5C3DT80_9BASI|nr:uncharacterized protein UTRI_00602_B [Ustilago trichophora]
MPSSYTSSGSASCSLPQHTIQYNHSPSAPSTSTVVPQIRFPSTSSESRPTISPSSSSSSTSSWNSNNDVHDRPPTPPSNPSKGFRLPRFSLWGRNTPDTLLSDSNSSLSPPSNVAAGLNNLHITKQRAHSLQGSTNAQHLALEARSPSQSASQPATLSASSTPMPALTFIEPAVVPSPMSSPKLGGVWRLGGGLFASSTASSQPRKGRPQTADPSTTRDATIVPPASQFAAWSELMHAPAPPNRSTTFSSISSTSCSSSSRPHMKKIRSQESIRSVASARLPDGDSSTFYSYSSIPTPKATKTKLRSKSKAGKETDFERVFLAQELCNAPLSMPQGGSIGRSGSEAKSPSIAQTEFFTTPSPESRRKRASWAPRRSTSPQASIDRRSSDMMCSQPRASITRSSVDQQEGESQVKNADSYPQRSRIDRQLSTSSHLTTASSATTNSTSASDALPPKSPILGASNSSELDQPEDTKAKRSKATTTKRKTYALQFSLDGRYLAAAGSDHLIRVYEVITSPSERAEEIELAQLQRIEEGCQKKLASTASQCPSNRSSTKNDQRNEASELAPVFKSTPIRIFAGHGGDVLDLSWSKNNFLLSCSSDKTAKLWHPNRSDCLCTFSTSAIVSSIDFHPTDDRFFVTGGLDGKLRLWNISARRVQSINDVPGVITAVAFSSSGSVVCVGTHSGSMLTFSCSDALHCVNTVTVKSAAASKSTQASKITSIQPIKLGASDPEPASTTEESSSAPEYMTVTSNDSRVRIYSIASRRLISRFKSASYLNRSSQIRATTSSDSQFIVSGSEDASIHVWSLASNAPLLASLFSGMKRTKGIKPTKSADVGDNSTWRSWQAGSGSVRCAIFAPASTGELLSFAGDPLTPTQKGVQSRIIVSTDDSNGIKIWRTDPAARLV